MHTRDEIHANEQSYECDVCQKRFTRNATSHAHRRTRMKEKLGKYHLCQNMFSHNLNLHVHQIIMTISLD